MFGSIPTRDENVVQVDKCIREMAEDPVHESLERLCRVFQAEWHPEKFVESEGGDDGRLLDILLVHGDLVVPLDHVNLGEDGALCQALDERLNVGKWILIGLRRAADDP